MAITIITDPVSLVRSGQQIIGVELNFNEESTAEKAKAGIRKSLHIYFDASTYVTETEQTKWSGLINNGQSFENPGFLFQLFEETLDVVNVDDLPSQIVFL